MKKIDGIDRLACKLYSYVSSTVALTSGSEAVVLVLIDLIIYFRLHAVEYWDEK